MKETSLLVSVSICPPPTPHEVPHEPPHEVS